MSKPEQPRAETVRTAFEAVADEIDLETLPAGQERLQTFGAAFAMASKMVTVSPGGPLMAAEGGGDPIADLINTWESMSPETFAASWRQYATDPYVGFGEAWVGKVDEAAVEHWLNSEQLASAQAEFPLCSPREVKIENLQVVHLGADRAAVTYRLEETHANGKITAGNTLTVLMRDGGSWKVVATSKGGRSTA